MIRIPRRVHRAYARLFGYFWLPCPVCGVEFGGHEHRGPDFELTTVGGTTKMLCPACTTYGRLRAAVELEHAQALASVKDRAAAIADELTDQYRRAGVLPAGMRFEWSADE